MERNKLFPNVSSFDEPSSKVTTCSTLRLSDNVTYFALLQIKGWWMKWPGNVALTGVIDVHTKCWLENPMGQNQQTELPSPTQMGR